MGKTSEIQVARQNLRKAVVNTLLADPALAPDLRRNFDGSPSAHAHQRANKLADLVLDAVMKNNGATLVSKLKDRAANPSFKGLLVQRMMDLSGNYPFSGSYPNHEVIVGLAGNVCTMLAGIKVLANGEIVQANPAVTENAKPVKTIKPKARSNDTNAVTPVDDAALRTAIENFFTKHPAVLDARKGRRAFGLTLENRVKALSDAAMLVLAPKEGGTVGGWKANLTKMGKLDSTLEHVLQQEIVTNRAVYPPSFYDPPSQGGAVNNTPQILSGALCSHLQQWMKVEQSSAAAVDPKAPKAGELANKINGNGKDGRAA